jgi:cytochrome c
MDTFELNKIVGAGLAALLVTTVIGHLGNILVHPRQLQSNAYVVAGAAEKPSAQQAAAAPAAIEPISALLASASADSGKTVFKQCTSCHTADKGGKNGVGPNLWDMVGTQKAARQGFAYSSVLAAAKDKGGDEAAWGYEQLNAFLANPKAYLPGTKMTFAGLRKAEDRANVIAYLRSLSDSPKPLP